MSQAVAPAIVGEHPRFYLAPMLCRVVRLLTMFAMLIMPFAMASAPAAPLDVHHPSGPMAEGHCSAQPDEDQSPGWIAGCAMPCSAALPAILAERTASDPIAHEAEPGIFEPALAGILLEIATPPPKAS